MYGALKLGMRFSIGCPKGYEPNAQVVPERAARRPRSWARRCRR